MTNRFRRATQTRTLEDQQRRVNAIEFGTPLPTFRASITDRYDSFITDRRAYFDISTGGTNDTVFWDYWENGDERFFDEFIQPSGPDAGRVGAVDLLVAGIYSIRATIDWDDIWDGDTWIGSNYDCGGTDHFYTPWPTDILNPMAINHTRVVWDASVSGETVVEITAGQSGGGVRYIPGGFTGFWAMPPHLTIVYLGGISSDPSYYGDV